MIPHSRMKKYAYFIPEVLIELENTIIQIIQNTIIQIINWVESRRVSILQKIAVKLIVIQIVPNETKKEKENTLRRKQKQQ